MFGVFLRSFMFLVLAVLAAAPGPVAAEGSVTIVLDRDANAEAVRRAVEAARATGRDVVVRFADAPSNPATPTGDAAGPQSFAGLWAHFVEGVRRGNAYMLLVPSLLPDIARHLSEIRNGGGAWGAAGLVALLFAVSLGAGFAVKRTLTAIAARRHGSTEADLPSRFAWSVRVLLADLAGLATHLVVATVLTSLLLPYEDLARTFARETISGTLLFFAYLISSHVLLAPGPSGLPLLPLKRIGLHRRYMMAYSALGAVIIISIAVGQSIASDPRAVGGAFAALGGLITGLKIVWFWHGRQDFAGLVVAGAPDVTAPSLARRTLAAATGPLLVVSAILIWVVGRIAAVAPDGARWASAAGTTQVLVVIVPIVAGGVVALLRALRLRRTDAPEQTPLRRAVAVLLERAAGAAVWIVGLALLGRLWSHVLDSLGSADSVALLRSLVAVTIVLVVGWLVWAFLVALFDTHAPKVRQANGAPDEDAEGAVATRLGTVLPVLRGVVLGMVLGLTLLVALARLGVDIAPLLAGFGILGLAISFGSQALVRDIVSGIFFMAEDAFRVGEYIDTGRLKGTVEKISLRSVQLRHQSGQIHTVPFGQITAVTNASRDWATVKFNLRLDRTADIEKARKTIKKVGAAMAEDAEIGPDIIQPLKMQGVAEIADNALVIRLKFTSKPAKASWLQREATKRVYQALTDAGVPFASNAVTVNAREHAAQAAAALQLQAAAPAQAPP